MVYAIMYMYVLGHLKSEISQEAIKCSSSSADTVTATRNPSAFHCNNVEVRPSRQRIPPTPAPRTRASSLTRAQQQSVSAVCDNNNNKKTATPSRRRKSCAPIVIRSSNLVNKSSPPTYNQSKHLSPDYLYPYIPPVVPVRRLSLQPLTQPSIILTDDRTRSKSISDPASVKVVQKPEDTNQPMDGKSDDPTSPNDGTRDVKAVD